MKNRLFYGDCLDVLKESIDDESIDLIYIDPPFNSKRDYNVLFESIDMTDTKAQKKAFADTWSNVKYLDQLNEIQESNLDLYKLLNIFDSIDVTKGAVSYLATMALRIQYMHRKLKKSGSFYLHCDPTMSHYLKVVCDQIFGEHNFLNEISWCYKERGISKTYFNWKHDIIFLYAKKRGMHTFNFDLIRQSYTEVSLKKFKHVDEEGRRFRIRGRNVPEAGEWRRKTDIPIEFESEYTYRQYLDVENGPLASDWFELPFLNQAAKERLGYPTQKPEKLLEKLIKASSNDGEVIADFFCGCGTAVAVAQRLNRQWIGVDISHLAVKLIYNRLLDSHRKNPDELRKVRKNIEINGFPRDVASARALASNSKRGRLKFQDWVIEFMIGGVSHDVHRGYDGYLTLYRDSRERDLVIIEVKSGGTKLGDIRAFKDAVDSQNAKIGVFVCFTRYVTKGMRIEAQKAGYYEQDAYGTKFPRVQILTIEELFEGKTVLHPNPAIFNITFR